VKNREEKKVKSSSERRGRRAAGGLWIVSNIQREGGLARQQDAPIKKLARRGRKKVKTSRVPLDPKALEALGPRGRLHARKEAVSFLLSECVNSSRG